MSPRSFAFAPASRSHPADAWRYAMAAALRLASAALARRARDVARPLHARRRRASVDPVYEFYAEAGAPEGALFADGEFVGRLDVHRL